MLGQAGHGAMSGYRENNAWTGRLQWAMSGQTGRSPIVSVI